MKLFVLISRSLIVQDLSLIFNGKLSSVGKEILLVVEAVSHEKSVDKEIIFGAIEAALASATQRKQGKPIAVRVAIDRLTGEYDTYRRWLIVVDGDGAGLENPMSEITLAAAQLSEPELEIGDYVEEEIDSIEFGRIAAQSAKQVIMQKIREAERKKVIAAYESRIGELINGTVKRIDKGNVILDLGGNAEALILKSELIPRESIRVGDRMRVSLVEIRTENRGPILSASRVRPELMLALFRLEVPEVGDGLIVLKGVARDPGQRAKLAVYSKDTQLDPVGACVGMRGSRVQAVSNELSDEKVDVIVWSDNSAQFVINAMAPAEVAAIVINEDNHSMDISVSEESLSKAIGRGGQNIRLASQLTGWTLNVMSEAEYAEKHESELLSFKSLFVDTLGVDDEVATILAEEGFSTLEEVAYVATEEMLAIEEFDEEIVTELQQRASDALLTVAIAKEEKLEPVEVTKDLLKMDGVDETLAAALAAIGVGTMENLAEQSTDELMVIDGMDEKRAGELIMTARKPWFENNSDA